MYKLGDKVLYKDKEETVIGVSKYSSQKQLVITYFHGWSISEHTIDSLKDYTLSDDFLTFSNGYVVDIEKVELINKEINFDIL